MNDLPLTPDDVADICAILDGSHYDRLEIRTGRFTLKLAREGAGEDAAGWTQSWDWTDSAGAGTAAATAPAAAEAEEAGADAVPSPLPGTFYRAPQPGAPPFVEVGDTVGPETVVGIVETMKLMNPVHAGRSGTVTAILVDNATAVAAGAVLMRIEPANA